MTDIIALTEIAEFNRVLAENVKLRHENNDLKAHCLNMLGKLDAVENPIPQPILDLASTLTLEIERNDRVSTIRRKITHHCGS